MYCCQTQQTYIKFISEYSVTRRTEENTTQGTGVFSRYSSRKFQIVNETQTHRNITPSDLAHKYNLTYKHRMSKKNIKYHKKVPIGVNRKHFRPQNTVQQTAEC